MKTVSILVIEDVDPMRALLEMVVKEIAKTPGPNYQFKLSGLAANGAEARFELTRRRPGIVLLDEILPGESALDLLEEFKAEAIPVILMTSLEGRTLEEFPLPVGAFGRVVKPTFKTWQTDRDLFVQEFMKAFGSALA